MTREEWLSKAVEKLRPRYAKFGKLPEKIQVLTSWPKRRSKNVIVGECYDPIWTKDKITYITITPLLGKEDAVEVLDTLVHELIHALGIKGHGGPFKKVGTKLGLEGKMTQSHAGETLKAELKTIADDLGPYPHDKMIPPVKKISEHPKTNGGAIKFYSKAVPEYNIFIYRKWLQIYGPPICPMSKKLMIRKDQ